MKRLMVALTALGIIVATPTARAACGSCGDEGSAPAAKAENADKGKSGKAEEPVIVSGTITKEVTKNKKGMEIAKYVLTDARGKKVNLPPAKKTDPSVKYDEYVNVDVKVTGTGTTKKDGSVTKLKSISAIEKVQPPAPAPAPKTEAK